MQASLDEQIKKSFFNRNSNTFKRMGNQEYLPCNCPNYENIIGTISIDHSMKDKPKILFSDSNSEIIAADKHGCYCKPVYGDTEQSFNHFTTDVNKIFWSNRDNTIYFLDRNNNVTVGEKSDGSNFLVYGNHVQPFPISKCLIPKIVTPLSLFDKTSNSITLKLPEIHPENDCENVSMASVKYKISYKIYKNDNISCPKNCSFNETYENLIKIENLEPYTKYIFMLSTKNYFTDLKKMEEHIGNEIILQTAAGSKY